MNRRGVTLAECAVALAAGGLVLAALHVLLLAAARARSREEARREARVALRAAAGILRADLQAVSAPAGDLVAVRDSAITVRAFRGHGTVCAQPAPDRLVLDAASFAGLRAADPARDAVRVPLDNDPGDPADDTWWIGGITAVRASPCPGGQPGTELTLTAAVPDPLSAGAPVRVLETVEYRLYADASGLRWLGTRTRAAAGWTVTSPLAGPFRPGDGIRLAATAPSGTLAAPLTSASLITVTLRARSSRTVIGANGIVAPVEDSLRLSVAVAP